MPQGTKKSLLDPDPDKISNVSYEILFSYNIEYLDFMMY